MTGVVSIVDDDAAIRDALAWLLQSRGVEARTFDSAEAFLAAWTPDLAGCLLLDIRMEGMSGLDLFQRLGELGSTLPVIFLTGHGDVPMAVGALKQGARDFVEKPFNDNELVDRIADAVSLSVRLDSLSDRERQVMDLVLAGKLNKVIADELGISMRTVEVHRAHVFEKMGVRTAVELARVLAPGRQP
jgi:two-component system response regulator DctR